MSDEHYQKLKEVILKEVFVTSVKERIVDATGEDAQWLFDFRRVLIRADVLERVANLFWEKCKEKVPFQVGGVEVAAIPLVTALILRAQEEDYNTNGFFIRKSRKKYGLLRMIEGRLTDEKVVLIDDIINTGSSFMRQVEVLEALGKKVIAVFTILRYRNLEYYEYFHKKGIEVYSFFSLDDFTKELGVKNRSEIEKKPVPTPFRTKWLFRSENPNYFYVVAKSAPAIDETKIYFGSDSGNFWALNQSDGSVAWKYKVGFHAKGKYIFSSPALYKNTVYFGAYDGNFYALNKETGKPRWIFMEADWIGSSPCIAADLKTVFIGLEFGLWKKKGGIAALDLETGRKKWEQRMPEYVHSSPAYSKKFQMVICGCNDFSVYAFDARRGKLLWKHTTGGEVKQSFAIDDERGIVAFGSFDKHLYILDIKTGALLFKIQTQETIYSTPLISDDFIYVSSLDKMLYCINLNTRAITWKFSAAGRIFASPEIIKNKIYVGSNDARLYELDALTGENTAIFQSTERITNKIAYNEKTEEIFLPTFANEIYCLSKSLPSEITLKA